MTSSGTRPLVSVIMAAYNRSNVLRLAVESVVRQEFTDWELIVVGDACTDDTAEVVASFGDPRIRFVNLEQNTGEQSGPNNEGFRRSQGRYVAYLSQDDLWFPDHLRHAVTALHDTGLDGVTTVGIMAVSAAEVRLQGVLPGGRYDPRYPLGIPASLWLMKRELLDEIGGWRSCRAVRLSPSQDLLVRAYRAGKQLRMVPQATAIVIPSGVRMNSYAVRDVEENARYYERMCSEPGFREAEILGAALLAAEKRVQDMLSIPTALKSLAGSLALRLGLLLGMSPLETYCLIRFRRKGSFIDHLRRRRGLPPLSG